MRFLCVFVFALALGAQDRLVLRTGVLIDGTGAVLRNQRIVVEGGRIVAIGPDGGPGDGKADFNLSRVTVMPGWIDTHIHLNWHLDAQKKSVASGGKPEEMALYTAADGWMTLQAGFTTVQSLGSAVDAAVRDRINEGVIPGPRVLTSMGQIQERNATPEQLRETVRKFKADGADAIKLFATAGLGAGGGQTMTDAQVGAVCGEARAVGLRSVVHAIGDSGARAAVMAGCTAIEHGTFLKDETLELMAKSGTYFDPNFLVLHNYLDHRGSFTFTDDALKTLEKGLAPTADVLRRARAKGVKVVFGTDAVAGSHGRNAEEFIYRVKDAGEKAMDAIVSATSMSAESLGMGKEIGKIAVGYQADLIAVEGNPLEDITAVRRVVFVMKGGKIFKNSVRTE